MADLSRMTIGEVAGKVLADEHDDLLQEAVALLADALMEVEVEDACGAGYRGRSPERMTQRNGLPAADVETRVGEIEVAIPKLRRGQLPPEPPEAA